ncbi:putative metalloprotease CJM1_0395 family protein [Pseudovibrio sp. Tun.PSC04-5.I4]|uniref:putative metalloprotease CJM1_0395 family protein n=1 Tax=Pseudovibrio sp. Tun.PSC04-5.I4 TaxID=1798213 RepID=UPI00088BD686|nr:putative metalloprotease CJM1_0395 family protein [Pseudovibrio sp. Tun.PSC04-5.I4]SDR47275.1 SprA-related family protein [Pseudovibrio sp. Tun.PSC04-5.I4]
MIDRLGASFSGLTRSASYNAAQPARENVQEAKAVSIEHAVPKDSIEISSDLTAHPVAAASSSEQTKNESNQEPSEAEQKNIQELKTRDAEVRTHEQAHAAAGGAFAGAPNYTETTGPDGHAYATAGEVSIDSGPIAGDPNATIAKLNTVIAAALAPAEPSGQDQAVASQAQQNLAQAYTDLQEQSISGGEDAVEEESEASSLQSLLQIQEYPETASDPAALIVNATQAYQAAAV